ncbi:MAG TPA: class I SAM-dependent methyltransferase [Anaerolineales bacterium]|nr:class I SAM-dependent methyltransferase [Anaerolineales bacterium]
MDNCHLQGKSIVDFTASYEPNFFKTLFEVEDHHFWFRARNMLIGRLFEQLSNNFSQGYRVLEIGCGTGNVLRVLEQACSRGTVFGMDYFHEGLCYARKRTEVLLLQGDMRRPPFQTKFDLIGLFDVLEHLPDDRQVLTDIHSMLSDRGLLVLTVPAYSSLWSYFDEASGHYRRYEPEDLLLKLTNAGFVAEHFTPFMMSLFPILVLYRRMAGLIQYKQQANRSTQELTTNELRVWPIFNDVFYKLLSIETFFLSRRFKLPIGTSLLVVASKSGTNKIA